MAGPKERYETLGLTESLCRIYRYPLACKELASILRSAYSQVPKNLQALIFKDTITAFRLLPEMQIQSAIAAANTLLQSAEAALPKQKRVMAVKEFKHAMVANKRRCKYRLEEEGVAQLSQDVLVHIFSFLDLRSLVSAAVVCRSWNASTSDNHLWQLQYVKYFGNSDSNSKIEVLRSGLDHDMKYIHLQEDVACVDTDWRYVFKRAYEGISSKDYITYVRGCCRHCNTIIWLSDIKCSNCVNFRSRDVKPLSTQQIVDYIVDDCDTLSSIDSDSDSGEGNNLSMWWVYP